MAIALVGDVVASRRVTDRAAMLQGLQGALGVVTAAVAGTSDLALGNGDEFSGSFPAVADAVEAALRLRLAVAEIVILTVDGEDEPLDVRVGLGAATTAEEDGRAGAAAWWCARDALRAALELPSKTHWPPSTRVVFRSEDRSQDGPVNAYLLCQDQLFARMDLRDRRALQGLLDGERQVDVAAALGITQPAVARRLRDRGALAIKRGLESLRTPDLLMDAAD